MTNKFTVVMKYCFMQRTVIFLNGLSKTIFDEYCVINILLAGALCYFREKWKNTL